MTQTETRTTPAGFRLLTPQTDPAALLVCERIPGPLEYPQPVQAQLVIDARHGHITFRTREYWQCQHDAFNWDCNRHLVVFPVPAYVDAVALTDFVLSGYLDGLVEKIRNGFLDEYDEATQMTGHYTLEAYSAAGAIQTSLAAVPLLSSEIITSAHQRWCQSPTP